MFFQVPHSCAALASLTSGVPDPGGHLFEVSHHAEACTTISDHLRPPALRVCVASLDFATLVLTLSRLTHPHPRSRWTHTQHLALRGSLDRKKRLSTYLENIAPFLKEREQQEGEKLSVVPGKSFGV
ncbi:hypothetical protein EDB85DRAFT_1904231 [Lactarius pseudohatsudake]|nr:hypothetical protein EDB85DRAFT_1904231 [Lactarius pseudohatsudake]